jgi:drug/metabolite transporter (DMT)-like permease
VIGLLAGELGEVTTSNFTPRAIYAFFHLLVFGSLVGFVAYTWLLGHVSITQAGTYAYVNPVIAILVGWRLGGEEISGWILGGMGLILSGVALVRSGGLVHTHGSGASEEEHQLVAQAGARSVGGLGPSLVLRAEESPKVTGNGQSP